MANKSIKDAFQRFWEYVIEKIGAHNTSEEAHGDIRAEVSALAEQANKKPTASDVTFADGETFQQKYDSGELKGEDGSPGETGETGPAGAGVKSMTYNSSTNKWTVTLTDNNTITVDGPAIPDVSGFMPKSGGTFTGAIYAMNGVGTAAQLRNTALVTSETYPTVNGQINWMCE